MLSVAHIFCHPIKGVGRLEREAVALEAGKTMPADRVWAVTHEASKFDASAPEWTPCNNFIRGAKSPALQAISISGYDEGGDMTLSHPSHAPHRFNPANTAEHAAFIAWLAQFVPQNRAQPQALVAAPARGMTDSPFPSISILNLASLEALAAKASKALDPARFRGNIWLAGMAPWAEFDLIGKTIQIGDAQLLIRERIGRCMATTVDPATGKQDVDTLGLLHSGWGHKDFGVYAEVIKSGTLTRLDGAHIL